MPKIGFCFCYESGHEHFLVRYKMEALRTKREYAPQHSSVTGFFGEPFIWSSRERALMQLFRAISLVRFMECTGVTHSRGHLAEFPECDPQKVLIDAPPVFDHWRVWSSPPVLSRLTTLVTNEPYVHGPEGVAAWCAAAGWDFVALPAGYGFWRPPATKLFLMAPAKARSDLSSIADSILENVPRLPDLMPSLEQLSPSPVCLGSARAGELVELP